MVFFHPHVQLDQNVILDKSLVEIGQNVTTLFVITCNY
jgi:hypothetical protein